LRVRFAYVFGGDWSRGGSLGLRGSFVQRALPEN
jgi:hypothetical protein